MSQQLNPQEWARKMKNAKKLLQRRYEFSENEIRTRCSAVFEKFAAVTNLKVKQELPKQLHAKKYPAFLKKVQESMDCDPFMPKSEIHALMLEAWSSLYDLSKISIELQRHEIEVMSRKPGIVSSMLHENTERLHELEKESASFNARFALCRVVNHIDKGAYSPPKTVAEQRKHLSRSFLALSAGSREALTCAKEARGAEEMHRCLTDGGQNPNQTELATGAQPLHYACMRGDVAEVRVLLDARADPNAQTLRGFSPLHFAYQYEHEECVNLLLQHGARVDVKSTLGKTPGQMKVSKGAILGSTPVKPFY